MTTDQTMRAIYLGLLALAIGGSFLAANRQNLGKTLQHALIWGLIFVGMIGAIGLWEDIQRNVSPRQAMISDSEIEVPRSADGHYYLVLDINDVPVRFVVDTGASQVVLTQEDASRVGVDTGRLNYLGSASTANGVVRTAPVTLDKVALGQMIDTRLQAVVNEGAMEDSLLGMEYLSRFSRIEIAGDRLVLVR